MATGSSILAWRIPELGGLSLWRCRESDMTERLTLCTRHSPDLCVTVVANHTWLFNFV